jgi:hypothetical protein
MQAASQYIYIFLVMTTILNFVIAVTTRVKTRYREYNYMIA